MVGTTGNFGHSTTEFSPYASPSSDGMLDVSVGVADHDLGLRLALCKYQVSTAVTL